MQLLKIEMTNLPLFNTLLPMVEKDRKDETNGMPVRYPEFGERVRAAMVNSGVTVADIKKKVKVSYEMARRYTLGIAMPRPEKMLKLATVLGVEAAVLQFDPKKRHQDEPDINPFGWPFNFSKERYDRMPISEKERLEDIAKSYIMSYEIRRVNKELEDLAREARASNEPNRRLTERRRLKASSKRQ